MKAKLNADAATVALFSLILAAASAARLLSPDREYSETENRMLSQRPRVSVRSVLDGGFMDSCEAYVGDQFFFRDGWIALKTQAERLLLFRLESRGVCFAADGYLIDLHSGVFCTERAAQNAETLARFAAEYAPRFAPGRFTVLIAPNAADVLSEKIPASAPPSRGKSYRNAIASRLPAGVFCDAADELLEHRGEYLYFRTDHHWTMRAAFYAYRAFARQAGLSVLELSDCEASVAADGFKGTVSSKLGIAPKADYIEAIVPAVARTARFQADGGNVRRGLFDGEKCSAKDKYAYFLGGNYPFARIRTDAEGGRRILVIKDSYANCFIPFLADSFSEIGVLDVRFARRSVRGLIDGGGWTDVLVLYNAAGFAADESAGRLLR